jgi:hypothetical protein
VVSVTGGPRIQTLVVNEGETIDGIDFALVRGGVITGKVTDAENHPVVEQTVYRQVAAPVNPQAGMYSVGPGFQTDDRGVYRMFGIVAGRYKISVGRGEEDSFFVSITSGRAAYKQTFYPDVTDRTKATVVEVTEGSEASNIDIVLGRSLPTYAASGRVVDESGQPVPNTRFGLQLIIAAQRRAYAGSTAVSNNQGEFRIENLAAGKYGTFMLPQPGTELRADGVTFDIVDQDVSGLEIKLSKGASVTGTVGLEGTEDKDTLANLLQLRLQVFVQGDSRNGNFVQTSLINADGSFHVGGLQAGTAAFSLGSQNRLPVKGFSIARIERDGQIQGRGVELKGTEQVSGVRIVVHYGSATIRGVIKFEDGTIPEGIRFSLQFMKIGEPGLFVMPRPPQVDSRGHFLIEGLVGGLYDFQVRAFIPNSRGKPLPPLKQQVNIVDAIVNDVTLTIPKPSPGPTPP